jgi:ABC-type sugar transport system substrate-binding protein
MKTIDIISIIGNLAIAFSFLIALVFGIVQVKAVAKDRKERLTIGALVSFQTREFAGLMNFIYSYDFPSTYEEWQKRPADEQTMITQFIQVMESMGILLAEKLIDIDLVDKTIGSLVTTAWDKHKTMILDAREKQEDAFLSEYFQWLAERMEERLKVNLRQPYYQN